MRPTEELHRDHDVLHAKLTKLEGWLPHVQAAPMTVKNLMSSIARRLRMHMQKEELLLLATIAKLPTQPKRVTHQLLAEHQGQHEAMTGLLELLATGRDGSVDEVSARASEFIAGMCEHMASEEARLFPVIDQILDGQFD